MRNTKSDHQRRRQPASLDEIDRRVVAALQAEGRRPFRSIADELGISESVVRYRAQRLEEAGILQIVGIADPLKIGFDLMAMVGVRVRPGLLGQVNEQLQALPETSYVATVAGAYDALVEVVCRDTAHFQELLTGRIHHIDGVASTESFLILEIHKMAYGWGVGDVPLADVTTDQLDRVESTRARAASARTPTAASRRRKRQ